MKTGKITALLLSGVMAASVLAGCGSMDKAATAATFDEEKVSLGLANFAARLQQASYDDFYVAYFGEEVWSSDLYGNGTTMQDSIKNDVMESLFAMYTLKAHAAEYGVELSEEDQTAIADAASAFIAANSQDALDVLGAEQAIVEEYLTLATIQSRMREAIVADADTNVSDEEANTGAYSYVRISKKTYTDADGNAAEYTEEELGELEETVGLFAREAKTGTLEDAAEQYSYTVNNGTFTASDEAVDETVLAVLKELEEGAVSDVIDTENNYYVVRLDAKTDAEATEATRENIIAQRESDLYKEVLDGYKEGHVWTVDEKVWEKVSFDNLFTTVQATESTEDVQATEQ